MKIRKLEDGEIVKEGDFLKLGSHNLRVGFTASRDDICIYRDEEQEDADNFLVAVLVGDKESQKEAPDHIIWAAEDMELVERVPNNIPKSHDSWKPTQKLLDIQKEALKGLLK